MLRFHASILRTLLFLSFPSTSPKQTSCIRFFKQGSLSLNIFLNFEVSVFLKTSQSIKETYILGRRNKVTDTEKSRYGAGISEYLVLRSNWKNCKSKKD